MKFLNLLLSLAIAFWIVGCATSGRPFDMQKVNDIRKGQTTRAELEQWFGKPYAERSMVNGARLVWQHTVAKAIVGIVEQQELFVTVDNQRIVTEVETRQRDTLPANFAR
jgi:hypothetical protein